MLSVSNPFPSRLELQLFFSRIRHSETVQYVNKPPARGYARTSLLSITMEKRWHPHQPQDLSNKLWTLVDHATGFVASALEFSASFGAGYRRARFGHLGDLLYISGLVDTDAVRDVHFNINFWTDEEAMAWKNSFVSSCNATSIAGAIFATLGLQAMQLPGLNATHWTARACFMASMVLGILSVTASTSQQHAVGMLNNALAIRLWLSRGQSESGRYLDTELDHQPFNIIPLESSIAAIKLTSLPRRQLQVAVFLFIVGILLFCILSWLEEVTDKPSDYRNLFIVTLATAIVFPGYHLFWKLTHLNDERKRTEDFDLKSRGSYEQPYYLEKLKRDLQRVQNLAAEMEREQMQIYAKTHCLTIDELVANLKHSSPPTVDRAAGPSGRPSKDLA
jgi:hypothetical protein